MIIQLKNCSRLCKGVVVVFSGMTGILCEATKTIHSLLFPPRAPREVAAVFFFFLVGKKSFYSKGNLGRCRLNPKEMTRHRKRWVCVGMPEIFWLHNCPV